MKRRIAYNLAAVTALILFVFDAAFAAPPPPPLPEPGTLAALGAVIAGGLIAKKVAKRK